jgi:hypothetical protein
MLAGEIIVRRGYDGNIVSTCFTCYITPMGLDAVEILLAVEDRFAISIPDVVASEIRTVGELSDFVCSLIATDPRRDCLTQRVFYRLRGALMVVGVERGMIRPDATIEMLIPPPQQRLAWAQVENASGYALPRHLRRGDETIGSLARCVIAHNRVEDESPPRGLSREEIWQVVRQIVAEHTALPLEQIERTSRFIDDLQL